MILHQTWYTQDDSQYQENIDSWALYMPEYDRKVYVNDEIEATIKRLVPWHYETVSKFNFLIEKIDFLRYALLWVYGGLYLDMDMKCLHRVELEPGVNIGVQTSFDRNIVSNEFMSASEPQLDVWTDIMNYIVHNYSHKKYIPYNTGGDALSAFFKLNRSKYNNITFLQPTFYDHTADGTWRQEHDYTQYLKLCNLCKHTVYDCHCFPEGWYYKK